MGPRVKLQITPSGFKYLKCEAKGYLEIPIGGEQVPAGHHVAGVLRELKGKTTVRVFRAWSCGSRV